MDYADLEEFYGNRNIKVLPIIK